MLKGVDNFSSKAAGACVISQTSEQEGYKCENVLLDSNEEIWMSDAGLPQEFVLRVNCNSTIKIAGWYCHKRYVFNPRKIRMYISKEKEGPFIQWASLKTEENVGLHLFKLKPIPQDFSYYKFEIVETFGGNRVYLNKLYLLTELPDIKKNRNTENPVETEDVEVLSPTASSPGLGINENHQLQSTLKGFQAKEKEDITDTVPNFDDLMFNDSGMLLWTPQQNNSFNLNHGLANLNNTLNATMMLNYSNISLKEISDSPLVAFNNNRLHQKTNGKKDLTHRYLKKDLTKQEEIPTQIPKIEKREKPVLKEGKDSNSQKENRPPSANGVVVNTQKKKEIQLRPKSLPKRTVLGDITNKEVNNKESLDNRIKEARKSRVLQTNQAMTKAKRNVEELHEKLVLMKPENKENKEIKDCVKKVDEMRKELDRLQQQVKDLEQNADWKKEFEEFKNKFYEKVTLKLQKSMTKVEQKVSRDMYKIVDEKVRQMSVQLNMRMNHDVKRLEEMKMVASKKEEVIECHQTNETANNMDTTSEQVANLKLRIQQL
ncbi:hypothetical protein ABK040_010067 [Willaertia magna]